MNKKVKIAIVSCMAAVLVGCSASQESAQVQDTIVIAQGQDPNSLDTHATNDQPSSRVSGNIYSRLVEFDKDMNIVPGLAESWDLESATSTVFHLRKGVKFHNGEELKASDIKFSLERMIASPAVGHMVNAIEEIEIIDDYTVRVITSEPFGPLLHHLTHTASSIMNEKAISEAGEDYGQNPIGTGPYKFVEWQIGDRVILEAFDDYYGGKQEIPNAVFRNIAEGTNRTIALETGEVHIAYDIEPIDMSTVVNHDNLRLQEVESLGTEFFGFNTQKAPFDNILVRQAIAYVANADDIIEAVLLGGGRRANSPIAPKVFGHNPDAKLYSQDIEKARALMAEAGMEDGFSSTIWTNDTPLRIQKAQILQAQLRAINIDASIEVLEWGAFLDGTSRGDHEMFMLGWTTSTGDADFGLVPQFSSSSAGSAGNRTFYRNSEVDELLMQARASIDPDERLALYARVQEIIQHEVPFFALYSKYINVGLNKNVDNFNMAPTGHHRITDVRFGS